MLLVNKYTPQTLIDFSLPKQLTNTFDTLIEAEHLNILIVGGMGTGKSSMINAILKQYYGDYYDTREYNQNVMFINNLHEQGISYYRSDVKIFCQTSSVIKSKKKIVVIDDLDLIPEQSQQAFRNCIDKYGSSVCFLSTCSNNQKVIESIQSRLSIIKLPLITPAIMWSVFDNIINTESITVTKDASKFIISICNSTIKTLINYIEKCKLMNCIITYDIAQMICSDIDIKTFNKFTNMIKKKELYAAIHILYSIYDDGYSVVDIMHNYFAYIKITSVLSEEQKYKIIPFLCKYITVFHEIHENDIELSLFTNNLINILT
jgi:DNA polymerase III delta prime subunit